MKRFYCTVCKKVKRVQNWPVILENQESENPELRVGMCNRHASQRNVLRSNEYAIKGKN